MASPRTICWGAASSGAELRSALPEKGWAAGGWPRGCLLPQGACPAGCTPHFLFGLGRKENGPCTVQKKRPLLVATLHVRAKLLYGGRREMVPAGLRWLPDGRGGVRYRLERGFPRRGCKGQRGARTHLVCFSFRAFRCATRCRILRGSVSGSEKRSSSMR